jgi:hypothetical protein
VALSSLTTDATGSTRILANIAATGSTLTFNDPVVLAADVSLTDSGASGVFFNNTLNSDGTPRDLTGNTTGGGITRFGGNVGGISPLDVVITDAVGSVLIDASTIAVNTLTINDPVRLDRDTTVTATASASFTSTIDTTTGEQNDLTINATPVVTLNGAIGSLAPIDALTVTGATTLGIANVTANSLSLSSATVLLNGAIYTALAGPLTINSTTSLTVPIGSSLTAAGAVTLAASDTGAASVNLIVDSGAIIRSTAVPQRCVRATTWTFSGDGSGATTVTYKATSGGRCDGTTILLSGAFKVTPASAVFGGQGGINSRLTTTASPRAAP